MNTVITSKEAILDVSRRLIREQGWSAVSIRNVAAACNVSIGSIYNYFSSKADLTAAAVESIWKDIFHFPDQEADFSDFSDCVNWIYRCMEKGAEQYPGFFTLHSMNFLGDEKPEGQKRMAQSWEHIQNMLLTVLLRDKNIRPEAFHEPLTPQRFTDIIFSLILSALIRQNYDSSAILELIRRTIY